MSELVKQNVIDEIQKGMILLGLKFSESELEKLKSGNIISLENRSLSEIGSAFIRAEVFSSRYLSKPISLKEISENFILLLGTSGVPIHCWSSQNSKQNCLLLDLENGKPIIKIRGIGLWTNL